MLMETAPKGGEINCLFGKRREKRMMAPGRFLQGERTPLKAATKALGLMDFLRKIPALARDSLFQKRLDLCKGD